MHYPTRTSRKQLPNREPFRYHFVKEAADA